MQSHKVTDRLYTGFSNIKWKIVYGLKMVVPIRKYKKARKTPVFLVFTPEHANLGDHAIAYAESRMLKEMGMEYYEITGHQLSILSEYGYLGELNGSVILVNGGGNLGTLWPDIEKLNRQLIIQNPNAAIVFMPNSIHYHDNEYGRKEFEKSKTIYNAHKSLYLYARERLSYGIMKDAYKHVKLMPDMVLSLNGIINDFKRKGCIACLRDDQEKELSDQEHNEIMHELRSIFGANIKESSTVLDHCVSVQEREKELKKKLEEFSRAELVVTDRLHGMLFSAITGTKCIVFNSKSPKMVGSFEWIKDLGYIRFATKAEDVPLLYSVMHRLDFQYGLYEAND